MRRRNLLIATASALVAGTIAAVATNLSVDGNLIVQGQITSSNADLNNVQIRGAMGGLAPAISVGGASSDTNANISLAGKGTGLAILGQTICTVAGATPKACNGQRGIVTTAALTTAALTDESYVIDNTSVTGDSLVICQINGYSGALGAKGDPVITSCTPGTGTITVNINNAHATAALDGTVAIGFVVLN